MNTHKNPRNLLPSNPPGPGPGVLLRTGADLFDPIFIGKNPRTRSSPGRNPRTLEFGAGERVEGRGAYRQEAFVAREGCWRCGGAVTAAAEFASGSSPPPSSPPGRRCRVRLARDSFHGLGDDFLFPRVMEGIGRGWAGVTSTPGLTERRIMEGRYYTPGGPIHGGWQGLGRNTRRCGSNRTRPQHTFFM